MNKILLITKREYITRIRNKTFLLSTFLTPIFMVGVIAVSVYFSQKNDEKVTIAVYDESNLFASKLESGKNITYKPVAKDIIDSIRLGKELAAFNGALYIPQIAIENPKGVSYYSSSQLGIFTAEQIEDDLNNVLEQERMIQAKIDTAQLSLIKKNPISLQQNVTASDGNSQQASSGISYAVGYLSGFLIYMIMFIYGAMVMRGVMEEKINRIAEVMVSSVKPIQLMMGKILGIGAVGLTQFLIWVILMFIGTSLLGASGSPESITQVQGMGGASPSAVAAIQEGMKSTVGQLNIPLILGMFLFYFIGGYLLYASLFAAVGSAVNEDPQDAQSMMFPITIPIILSFIMMSPAIANPTGSIATWFSIIPFTSPIIMMARIPFGVPGTVPYWQLGLSMAMMIIFILFITWLSARIYRTGILMYGKKPSWKELLKWVFIKR